LQLKRDWGRSYVEHDREALEHILAAEYVLVDDNGKTSTRQQMIEDFLTSGTIYETATYDDTRVQIYDNFAIVSGRGVVKGKGKNGSFHRQYFQRMSSSNAMGDGRPSQLTFPASVTCPSSEEKLSCKSLGDGNEGRSGNE
jgi:hypothetical protein